jgi:MinD superfamily P-loop ATPase
MIEIAIASGKGGTGKTTLSVNLASLLASQEAFDKIIICDLDVEEPNSGLFLNGDLIHKEVKYRMVPQWDEERCTLCKRCANICEFNAIAFLGISVLVFPELCHSCYACSELCPEDALPMVEHRMGELKHYKVSDKLEFIESRLDIGVEQAVPLIASSREYARNIATENTLLIYDAPPGTSCPVIEAVKNTKKTILITEPTPFGLHDLTLAVETMQEMKQPFGVVLNRSGENDNKVDEYCNTNNIEMIGKIPFMRDAAVAYSNGKLMIDSIPEIKNAITTIANNLLKEAAL